MPKWVNEDRQAHLVNLFHRSNGFCVFGEKPCSNPLHHHYEHYIDGIVKDWIADDRAVDRALWLAEQKRIHNLGECGYSHGQFGAISRDIYHEKQPLFYNLGQGMSVITFKPFVKLRIASSYMALYVDITQAIKPVSKNKKRKFLRYGKPLPQELRAEIDQACYLAVKDYLK